ncbi:MAG: hypothetical protein Q7S22_05220 [Candidatus Micrarchaeota archaeon]|nr:hypothetical protein [Candidatus Micrarchaeota archaeon]
MRQRTSRVTSAHSRTSVAPLVESLASKKPEGIIKDGFWCITLQGRRFRVPIKIKNKRWSAMTSKELVEFVKAYSMQEGIIKRSELEKKLKTFGGLYPVLIKRRLLNKVFPRKKFEEMVLDGTTFRIPINDQNHRNWSAMTSKKLVEFAKAYILENEITKIGELHNGPKALHRLCAVLRQKRLLKDIFSKEDYEKIILDGTEFKIPLDNHGNRNWEAMSNNEIIVYVKAYCKENGIEKKYGLKKHNPGMYKAISKRKLLDLVFSDIEKAQKTMALTDLATALESFGGSGK